MNTPLLVFGLVASMMTSMMIYYNFRVLQAFRENRDLAATKMILKEEVPQAFKYLSVSAMIFSSGAIIGTVSLTTGIEALSYFSEIGGIALIIGFTFFMKKISDSVTEVRKTEKQE